MTARDGAHGRTRARMDGWGGCALYGALAFSLGALAALLAMLAWAWPGRGY